MRDADADSTKRDRSHAGPRIKVKIETKTLGASLSWSDDPNVPPTPTGPHIINAPKGDAITVYGRTLRAMAFKTGMQDSPSSKGHTWRTVRIATPCPCRWYAKSRPSSFDGQGKRCNRRGDRIRNDFCFKLGTFHCFAPPDASNWKRASFRNGSNIGSSRSSAGVSGTF